MKIQTWIAAVVAGVSLSAHGAMYDFSVNTAIPDANPSGFVNSQSANPSSIYYNSGFAATFSGIVNPYIANVVGLHVNLTGGWNGDLTAYLRYDNGSGGVGFTTMLNRVGGNPSSSVYTAAGMDVTLIEGAGSGNIHSVVPTSGGTYQIDATGSSTSFDSFKGLDPTAGTWSIFFMDNSGGNVSSLATWGLDLEVVPEPVNVALGIVGGLFGLGLVVRQIQNRRVSTV